MMSSERVLSAADLGRLTAVREPVLLTTGVRPGPPVRRAGRTASGAAIWSTPIGQHPPEAAAARLAAFPGVRTVTVVAAPQDTPQAALASAFALHLAAVRAGRQLSPVWITAAGRPDPRPDWVRLPHLLTTTAYGPMQDTVVWELMPATLAPRWLGAPMPDQRFIEEHLDQLLTLRRTARLGLLPATSEGRHLAELLRERYLSLRLVYQHHHLFAALLCEHTWKGPR